ncbi:MAG TPA: class I SAM-dependent methyltransferase [Spirochaetia bacterium]|nr:class I SAM-dependent methyltransferase [Spirochaetia bacterium]
MIPKPYKGLAMEGLVAAWYAKNTRADMEDYRSLAAMIASKVRPGSRILEVAPGPGYTAVELARLGRYEVTGVDISSTFVEIARSNAKKAGVSVELRQGDAASMPFADNQFDFVVCRAAFKNFTQPQCALLDMHRVLRSGGTALIIDLRPDVSPQAIDDFNLTAHRVGIPALFMKWTFLHFLARNAHSKGELEEMISRTGFSRHRIDEDSMGYQVWLWKD